MTSSQKEKFATCKESMSTAALTEPIRYAKLCRVKQEPVLLTRRP